jgi:hypothetical protein
VPAAAVLVVARPWLVWVGLAYLVLFAVNLAFARRNDERAVLNDLVLIAECTAMVVVTWAVAAGGQSWSPPSLGGAPGELWVLTVVCALVLTGSTLHVKSLIRERRNPVFARLSRGFALASLGAAALLAWWWGLPSGWWLVVPFGALAARSVLVGRGSLRPVSIGMIELAMFVLVLACSALAGTG